MAISRHLKSCSPPQSCKFMFLPNLTILMGCFFNYSRGLSINAANFGTIKELVENTIVDLEDLENETKQNKSILENASFPDESRSANQEKSIFDYCCDLCKSLLHEIDQVEPTLHDPANHTRSKERPTDEAWESQILVTPTLYAVNRGDKDGQQLQFAGITSKSTTEQDIMREWSEMIAQRQSE